MSRVIDSSYDPEKVVKTIKEPHKRLTPSEIQTILVKYNYGVSLKELAEQFGCCTRTISKILKENGVTPSKDYTKRKAVPELVIHLYTEWTKPEEIAQIFGVSTSTILRILKKNNVDIRQAWDYPRK